MTINRCPRCGKTNKNTHGGLLIHFSDSNGRITNINTRSWCDRCYSKLTKNIHRNKGYIIVDREAILKLLEESKGDLGLKWVWSFTKVSDRKNVTFDGNAPCPYEWTDRETTQWNGNTYYRYPHGEGMEKYFHLFGTIGRGNRWVYYLHSDVWYEAHCHEYPRGIPKGHVIHHIDHNFLNNDPSNLQLMTREEHDIHHGRTPTEIDVKPRRHKKEPIPKFSWE